MSSYKSTAYAGTVPDYLTIDWVLGQLSEKKATARQRYRKVDFLGVHYTTVSKEV